MAWIHIIALFIASVWAPNTVAQPAPIIPIYVPPAIVISVPHVTIKAMDNTQEETPVVAPEVKEEPTVEITNIPVAPGPEGTPVVEDIPSSPTEVQTTGYATHGIPQGQYGQ